MTLVRGGRTVRGSGAGVQTRAMLPAPYHSAAEFLLVSQRIESAIRYSRALART